MAENTSQSKAKATLGKHLALLRSAAQLSLRDVEEATDKEVSNAYLSQLENDKIGKPSPNVLHVLSNVYKTSYEDLMQRAGYLPVGSITSSARRTGRAAHFAIEDLTADEEKALIAYLSFIRQQKSK